MPLAGFCTCPAALPLPATGGSVLKDPDAERSRLAAPQAARTAQRAPQPGHGDPRPVRARCHRPVAPAAAGRGLKVIIAGAGGAAHLPGMCAAWTPLPVLGVPIESRALKGVDSLLSIVQMPAGIPVGTLAIGRAGAVNAALLAAAILALKHPEIGKQLRVYRSQMTESAIDNPDPPKTM